MTWHNSRDKYAESGTRTILAAGCFVRMCRALRKLTLIALLTIGCVSHDRAALEPVDANISDSSIADSSACKGLGSCSPCECQSAICPVETPEVATSCSSARGSWPPPDECACEGGTCPVGETCFRVFVRPLTGGTFPGDMNICEAPCSVDADCSGGRVCRRNRFGFLVCAAPSCASDADCTADRCGHCIPVEIGLHGGGRLLDFTGSHCRYEGTCDSDSCAGCSSWGPESHDCRPGDSSSTIR